METIRINIVFACAFWPRSSFLPAHPPGGLKSALPSCRLKPAYPVLAGTMIKAHVLISSQYFAGFLAVLNRRAFQRRSACDLEETAPIGVGPRSLLSDSFLLVFWVGSDKLDYRLLRHPVIYIIKRINNNIPVSRAYFCNAMQALMSFHYV